MFKGKPHFVQGKPFYVWRLSWKPTGKPTISAFSTAAPSLQFKAEARGPPSTSVRRLGGLRVLRLLRRSVFPRKSERKTNARTPRWLRCDASAKKDVLLHFWRGSNGKSELFSPPKQKETTSPRIQPKSRKKSMCFFACKPWGRNVRICFGTFSIVG